MSEAFVGEIRMAGFNFAPFGWAFCSGQIMPIAQNTALFSLLGTNYGGNGQSTFGLPDLRGRTPIQWGQGPGLSDVAIGETGGSSTVTLQANNIPPHTHSLSATTAAASQASPANGVWAVSGSRRTTVNLYKSTTDNTAMSAQSLGTSGSAVVAAHNNVSPYLAVSFIIALQGIFPPRN